MHSKLSSLEMLIIFHSLTGPTLDKLNKYKFY